MTSSFTCIPPENARIQAYRLQARGLHELMGMKANSDFQSQVGEHVFKPVEDLEIILGYWRMVSQSLKEPRHGMSAREHLPSEYRRVTSQRYFELVHHGVMVSILRIIPGVSLRNYPHGILAYLKQPVLDSHTFCDLGIYHLQGEGDRETIARDCMDFSASYAQANGHSGLYIQVPLQHASNYVSLGFCLAGHPFQPEGCTQTYVPMIRITAPELQAEPEPGSRLSLAEK